MSLKQQTVSGLLWSFLDDLARGGLLFISGLVLARLLTPRGIALVAELIQPRPGARKRRSEIVRQLVGAVPEPAQKLLNAAQGDIHLPGQIL